MGAQGNKAGSSCQHVPVPGAQAADGTKLFHNNNPNFGKVPLLPPAFCKQHVTCAVKPEVRKNGRKKTGISQVPLNSPKLLSNSQNPPGCTESAVGRDEKPLDAHGEPQDVTSRQARGCAGGTVSRNVNWLRHFFQPYPSHHPTGLRDDRQPFSPEAHAKRSLYAQPTRLRAAWHTRHRRWDAEVTRRASAKEATDGESPA